MRIDARGERRGMRLAIATLGPLRPDGGKQQGWCLAGRSVVRRQDQAHQCQYFAWRDGDLLLPLTKTPVADTTGAGDAFAAALITGLARGYDEEGTARLAVAAAGATVGHPGGRPRPCARPKQPARTCISAPTAGSERSL
jgi:ribokinase